VRTRAVSTRSKASEEVDFDRWVGDDAWSILFPGETFKLQGVPESIARGHAEAFMCFHARAYTASALMCRRTLEAMCKDKAATKGSLALNLKELQARGVIDARLYAWADALRIVGNDAAHSVDEFMNKEDAKDGLDFTRAIVEYIYTFTDAFERFKARRIAQKNPPPVPPNPS
jgi:hypothetical protein